VNIERIRLEIEDLIARQHSFRIKLINGDRYEIVPAKNPPTLLSWGVFLTEYDAEWASFPYESIVGFESLIEE
jgi:hypothetical protein